MKGYRARLTGCCGTTSVAFGSYSSIDMVWARARLEATRRTVAQAGSLRHCPAASLSHRGCNGAKRTFRDEPPILQRQQAAARRFQARLESLLPAAQRRGILER